MGYTRLQHDSNHTPIQGFAPSSIINVTASTPVTVSGYLAIRPKQDIDYVIGSGTVTGTLFAGMPTVIHKSVSTFTFASDGVIEVMDNV